MIVAHADQTSDSIVWRVSSESVIAESTPALPSRRTVFAQQIARFLSMEEKSPMNPHFKP